MIRSLVKLALGYALTKAVARAGGPAGVLDAVLGGRGGHDERTNRGPQRTARQKRADARRRGH
jgi:hypothetical protein